MKFLADKQTLQDLNVFGKYKTGSLYSIFNQVVTSGGERLLEEMFRHPFTDIKSINARSNVFRYFHRIGLALPFEPVEFAKAERFLMNGGDDQWHFFVYKNCRRKLFAKLGINNETESFIDGMQAALNILRQLAIFFQKLQQDPGNPLYTQINEFLILLEENGLSDTSPEITKRMGFYNELKYDFLLRGKLYRSIQSLLSFVYLLDVCVAVAKVAVTKKFCFPTVLDAEISVLEIRNCRHPAIEKAVGNDLCLQEQKNILFLTGANMAGKSTFMKSVGSAFYLAHMGFPVAADAMRLSVMRGIYSSINVADDLQQGISHFYAEVLRVKHVATSVCSDIPLLVIFDELFKGTNVKDAYDATLAVTGAFGNYRKCHFIISTHIIEVGEVLAASNDNIRFAFMPTSMNNNIPTYTYRMQEGITEDRHGMMIIRNEGILDMIGT